MFQNAGPGFPSTAWSAVQGAQHISEKEREQAMTRLISVYWRPLYWTLRIDWKVSHEEAKDLTQEYLTVFIEQDLVESVTREKGRFRAYVKATLKHFMLNHRRSQNSLKRGGGRRIIPLENLDVNAAEIKDSTKGHFERELMCSILNNSLNDLKELYAKKNKVDLFHLFQAYYLQKDSKGGLCYQDLEKRFSLNNNQVKNRLAELRTNFRQIVLSYLRDGLSSDKELEQEIREVFVS